MSMSVFRINKTKDYTIMANFHLKEKGLSLKTKGLLSLMLSLPDDWGYSVMGIAMLSKDSVHSIESALKELKEYHYLTISQTRDETGKFGNSIFNIYEKPFMYLEPKTEGNSND